MKISDYSKQPLSLFLNELGSASPAPGGGAAAALTAALGAALLEMVSRLNRDAVTAKKARRIKQRLEKLMVLDAKAFEKVYAMYKNKASCCSLAYQSAIRNAAAPPEAICELSAEAVRLALSQKNKTSRWLISDLKECVLLLKASFESARLNVNVNLKGFHDTASAKKIDKRLSREYAQLLKNGQKIMASGA